MNTKTPSQAEMMAKAKEQEHLIAFCDETVTRISDVTDKDMESINTVLINLVLKTLLNENICATCFKTAIGAALDSLTQDEMGSKCFDLDRIGILETSSEDMH